MQRLSTAPLRSRLCFGIVVTGLLSAASGCRPADPLPSLPRVMLWAWDRPEHLTFLDPHTTGVAFLAGTAGWRNGHTDSRPRYQPLETPAGTAMVAVVRLESWSAPLPDADAIANEVLKLADLPRIQAIQIDFDARRSEREWYTDLLRRVRDRLRPTVALTITALASWCLGDPWITGLPVTEAVPMLFRMGAGEPREVREFSAGLCRSSLGVSTDESLSAAPRGRRVWIFCPRPWTKESYDGAMLLAGRLP
jgi:hypothetical protein